ncbi:MAG: hypothetical protein ACFB0Z_00860 [Candidatus Phaeomarinobacter sp.]
MHDDNDSVDPDTLPQRRCVPCGAAMSATEVGEESFSPFAWYECRSCGHRAKITPLADTGGWMAMALVAWLFVAGLIWLTSKPFDGSSVAWMAGIFAALMAPLLPVYLKTRRYQVIDKDDATWRHGFAGNLLFIVVLFAAVLMVAAGLGLVFG